MPYKVVLTFESMNEIQRARYLNKSYEQYFFMVLFVMLFKVGLTFEFVFDN